MTDTQLGTQMRMVAEMGEMTMKMNEIQRIMAEQTHELQHREAAERLARIETEKR